MSDANWEQVRVNPGRDEVKVCVAELSTVEQAESETQMMAAAFLLVVSTLLLASAING